MTNPCCAINLSESDHVADIPLPMYSKNPIETKDNGEDLEWLLVLFEPQRGGEIHQFPNIMADGVGLLWRWMTPLH